MAIIIELENRDFTPYLERHWDTLTVDRYSKSALTGQLKATLTATGLDEEIWRFIETLRCSVKLHDTETAKVVWVGFISAVEIISSTGVKYTVDIETMANTVSVMYDYIDVEYNTGTDTHTESIAEYGIKERLLSASEVNVDEAESVRQGELDRSHYPGGALPEFGGCNPESRAVIECSGWFETLNWRYYEVHKGEFNVDPCYEEGALDTGYKDVYLGKIAQFEWCGMTFPN
jgi:hypothetical protein